MAGSKRCTGRLLSIALMLGLVSVCMLSRAQDDWDAAEQDAQAQPEEIGFAEQNIDQWIFGHNNAHRGMERLETLLTLQMESVERVCSLSVTQKKKLLLAGRGDIERFSDSVEEVKEKFRAVQLERNNINQIWADTQPLQAKLNSGLFGEASLFRKVLRNTLDTGQTAQYEQQELERREFFYEAKVAWTIAMLENGVPLRDTQRQRLTTLLIEGTKPPKTFGPYDRYVVLYQAAKLPEEKLKPIFDDAQWRALQQAFAEAERMEVMLKRNGLIP